MRQYLYLVLLPLTGFGCAEAASPNFKTKSDCEIRYGDLKSQCGDKQDELQRALKEAERLRLEVQGLKSKTPELRDPTFQELSDFVKSDEGGDKEYDVNKYNCENFSLALRDAARERGFRCAYVTLNYDNKSYGHAITAFETLDHGLVYIEPQQDQVAYLKKGKPFGTIPLELVKRKYYACPAQPLGFAEPLQFEIYEGSLFDYTYFERYAERVKCYKAGLDAYNAAVKDYNNGGSRFRRWNFDAWLKNINAFFDEVRFSSIGEKYIVTGVKAHWG